MTADTAARAGITAAGQADGLTLSCQATMEFDGYCRFDLAPKAERDFDLSDCRLEVPLKRAFATYMMGLGCKGGYRPERWEWQWDVRKYQDSLWLGEGRNDDEGPDHWLVEASGIPFGLFSEMLEGGGNPWRGMLYAMTSRLPYCGNPAPRWKLWDEFGLATAELLGYWSPAVAGLQAERQFHLDETLPVPPSGGWLLVLAERPQPGTEVK